MSTSIKLVGVGGQGTILAAKVLSHVLIEAGYDVKMSEIHGMSQRGGSVSSELRFGDKVFSPVIEKGHVDILVAFEQMEAARFIDYLKPDGLLLVNDHKVNSMVTLAGKVPYPEGILDTLSKQVNTIIIPAHAIAEQLGNGKAMNIVMLGALSKYLEQENLDFMEAMATYIKPKYLELNKKAFQRGLLDTTDTTS